MYVFPGRIGDNVRLCCCVCDCTANIRYGAAHGERKYVLSLGISVARGIESHQLHKLGGYFQAEWGWMLLFN